MTLRNLLTNIDVRFARMKDNAAIALERKLVGAIKSGTLARKAAM